MGVAERREREKQQRQNDILDAAESVFFSKGIQTATMDEVAEEAELSKGTVYLYFKSKDDLVEGICRRGTLILKKMFDTAFRENERGIEKLFAIGKAYFRFAAEYTDYFNTFYFYTSHVQDCKNCEEHNEDAVQSANRIIEIVALAVAAGQRDGSVRSDLDPMMLAVLLWSQSTGVIQTVFHEKYHLDKLSVDPQKMMEASFTMMRSGLTG